MTREDINSYSYRISQASRTDLVVIMLEMEQQYIDEALQAYTDNDMDSFCIQLKYAKRVNDALAKSLDMRYAISAELMSIYMYIGRTISRAINRKVTEAIPVVGRVIGKLHTTFVQLALDDKSGPLMDNTEKIYAGLTYSNGRLDEIAYDIGSTSRRGYTV